MKTKPLKPKNKTPAKIIAINRKKGKVLQQVNHRFYRIVESKWFVRLKNRFIPNIGKFLIKLGFSICCAIVILLALTLFDIVPFTWDKLLGSLALYFILEEIKNHHLLINRKRSSK